MVRFILGSTTGAMARVLIESSQMLRLAHSITAMVLLLLTAVPPATQAGGSSFNTFVIVNSQSTNSLALGNYYCERRQIPPENVLRIDWPGGRISWTLTEFQNVLLAPLQRALAARQLSNQIHFLVLSMDIPFQVQNGSAVNSTTSTLFYGFKGPTDLKNANSSLAFSESAFEFVRALNSFLATMLTAGSLAQAKQLVDRGVESDGTFPSQPVVLIKTSDPLRNRRHPSFDAAMFNAAVDGRMRIVRTNTDSLSGLTNLLGLQTGLASFSVPQNLFVPGAIADSMTSFGGIIFGPNGQTTLLDLIHAEATASYGTVTEPSADPSKFPDPMVYFYQSRGFNIAESYYQSIPVPCLGLIVGEPLAAPFALSAKGHWTDLSPNQILKGTVPLNVHFVSDRLRPIQQVDFFLNGRFFRTLTNIPPAAGNVVSAFMHGRNANYTVRSGDSLNLIASNLSGIINVPVATNLTGISASTRGDRLALTRFTTNVPPRPAAPSNIRTSGGGELADPNPTSLGFSTMPGSSDRVVTWANASRTAFCPSPARGMRSFTISGAPETNGWLSLQITRSDGSNATVAVTNGSPTGTAYQMTAALAAAVSNNPELRNPGGIAVDDVSTGWFSSGVMTFRSQTPGLYGAETRLTLSSSPAFNISPAPSGALNQNAADLLPRSHIYIAAGVTNLSLSFDFDATQIADGYHELTAVAYEGSHVRTQSRVTTSVVIQNGAFEANLELLEPAQSIPLTTNCNFRVTANQEVTSVQLLTTGGILETIANQNPATFTVNPNLLGVGTHSFQAIVTSASGLRYYTAPVQVRFGP